MLAISFVIIQCTGNFAIRPFIVQIMKAMRLPLDANWASVIVSTADISSNILCMTAMSLLHIGKRFMFLFGMAGCIVSTFGLSKSIISAKNFIFLNLFTVGLNAYLTIPIGTSSFNPPQSIEDTAGHNYIALFLFLSLAFCSNLSMTVPWMMISEIFPFR